MKIVPKSNHIFHFCVQLSVLKRIDMFNERKYGKQVIGKLVDCIESERYIIDLRNLTHEKVNKDWW